MPLSRPSGDVTSGLRAWCITLIVAASTPRSATLSGSVKSVPSPRSALRVIPTTTPWLKRPSDCSRPNCWTSARSPGVDWRRWNSPCSATSTGSTLAASIIRSAAFHQQSSKQPTTTNTMNAANYNWTEPINRASDKPGEIHTFLRGVRDEGAKTEVLRAGMLMDWGGVRADVIGPPTDLEGGLFSEINDNSVAILLSYGTARILLAGDAEAIEEEYMANGPYTGPLTILKVTHHGSNTSSTPLFLSRFPPKVAVIQCGADNPYGHPTPETLDRLHRAGAKVFRNDEDGDVIATIRDQELKVAVTKR